MKKSDESTESESPAESGSAASPAVITETEQSPLEQKIEAWFAKHFHNKGPLLEERVYNMIHAAKEDLKKVLGEESAT